MATLFLAGGRFARVFASNRSGISIRVSGSTDLPRRMKKLQTKFTRDAKALLRSNGTALCHEMAYYSMPPRANAMLTANQALNIYAQENQALAGVAFKSWDSKDAMFWLLSPYSNVADYVVKSTGFTFQSNVAQNLFNVGKFDLLRDFLIKKGFKPMPDIPKSEFVQPKAELGTFIQWKSQYKKGGKRGPYYVKDKASITRISNEKSLNNYASIVINGWLAASKALGDNVPSGVTKVKWRHGKGVGWGSASITRSSGWAGAKLTISNQYYNLNGIFKSSVQQAIWSRRMSIMDKEVKDFFKKMIAYFDSMP
jgi:hypothetical protein